jgi:membrane protease YdiL (CAAX protease family)
MLGGKPVIPYEPHARVPWRGVDVVVVLSPFWLLALHSALSLLVDAPKPRDLTDGLEQTIRKDDIPESQAGREQRKLEASHPLEVLIHESRNIQTLLFCALVAMVVAPIAEELLFRVVIQGWFESLEGPLRRRVPALRGVVRGTTSVVPTSLLFAAMHYRGSPTDTDPDDLLELFAAVAAFNVLTVVVAVLWLRIRRGATAADFGFVPEKFVADVRLGLLTFLAVVTPIYGLQIALKSLLPAHPIVDPVSLFFFSLALGTLYYRTHRVLSSIVAHWALNGLGLMMAWLGTL